MSLMTTILIAKELGISVGTLYYYFPNKHAILYALGAQWLEEMTVALADMGRWELESMALDDFVDKAVDRMLDVYVKQQAILPLAQALWAIPELRELDVEHDQLIINKMSAMYKRLGSKCNNNELSRLGRLYLELTHALLLTIVNQKDLRGKLKTGADTAAAVEVGKLVAERARAAGVNKVIFDRGGYIYHGRVKALADAARETELEF